MSKSLNLGCGNFRKEGYVNVDWMDSFNIDVKHDLNSLPYPFEDNEFDLIESSHSLEHLDRPFSIMREIHRIATPGAKVLIKVPHFSRGMTHAEHAHCFDITFPYYFDPTFEAGYQGVSFELKSMTFKWFIQPHIKKRLLPAPLYYGGKMVGAILDFFANLSPMFCSRIWCYWVGGFEEIEFEFTVVKD